MKKRVINFADNRLIGRVGEWGLILTGLAGRWELGDLPAIFKMEFFLQTQDDFGPQVAMTRVVSMCPGPF
ncbi:Uncharacterised protein [uncultured archaeon]|nr:Uncharacterised protein [uncultured archaeon]